MIICFFPIFVSAQSGLIIPEYKKINELINPSNDSLSFASPIIMSNAILFFYRGSAKSVILSGDFNNWSDQFIMQETRTNLWTAVWTNRLVAGKYKYRIKIDGIWISDPNNPNFILDNSRQKLSILNLTNNFTAFKKYPYWVSNNTYLFRHYSSGTQNVFITGDFNNWNPYSDQMVYKGAGYFEIELELQPKQIYLYAFVADGEWTSDENNKKQFRNMQNKPINAFYADQTLSIP
ncbi:MAG: glycogen-binding domain-containing protein [Brevinemataceae bacterium]